jgi:hypothetical protein
VRSLPVVLSVVLGAASLHPLPAQNWHVDPAPLLDIAGTSADGNVVLELAVGGARFSSGTLVIADGGASQLRFFDAAGHAVATVGRKGRGPNEFASISWLGHCARDSVFAWDFAQQRLTVVSAGGEILSQARLPADPSIGVVPFTLACSRSGVVAVQGWGKASQPNAAGVLRSTGPMVLLDAAGQLRARVGDIPGDEMAMTGMGVGPRPLGKTTRFAVSNDRLFVGTADSASIVSFDLTGKNRAVMSLALALKRPTRANQEQAVALLVAFVPQGGARDAMRQALMQIAMPRELPPYTALFTDPAGRLWIQTLFPGDDRTRLQWVSTAGRVQGRLELPRDMTVFEIGVDYVLGKYAEAGGEEHVAAYAIHGP